MKHWLLHADDFYAAAISFIAAARSRSSNLELVLLFYCRERFVGQNVSKRRAVPSHRSFVPVYLFSLCEIENWREDRVKRLRFLQISLLFNF